MKRARRGLGTALLAALLALPIAAVGGAFTASAAGAAVTNFTDPSIAGPDGIAAGPDGALWFTNINNDSIGRITTAGSVTNFVDSNIQEPYAITAGPDGALWYTNIRNGSYSIGRITTAGVVTTFFDPATISIPSSIAAGSDGALWFVNAGDDSIGRITTTGAVTNFTDPSISDPFNIAAGPDGALWFTSHTNNLIGRLTTSGAFTSFTDPSISGPDSIAAGPDGALWFTNDGSNSIGRITTAGVVTSFTDPTISHPTTIAPGPDGALWFTNNANSSIGRITTAGAVTNVSDPTISNPFSIASGSDGALWFTNNNNSIGRISVDSGSGGGGPPPPVVPPPAPPSDVVVARPGIPAPSRFGAPTDAHPTEQIITLPKQPGAQPVSVTLQSITPGPKLSAADKLLCPTTGNKCSGQISVVAGNFKGYVNKAHPIKVQILAKWQAKVGPGKLLMEKDAGGPPVQLAKCVAKGGKYNTPCLKSEVVSGSAARHNLVTTSTIFFVGTDPRFARHVDTGPDAPLAVKATAAKGKATVAWKPPVVTNGRVTAYTVTPHLGKVAQKSVSVGGTVLKATITGLKKGKSYTFTVIAKTALGISLASKASNAIKPT